MRSEEANDWCACCDIVALLLVFVSSLYSLVHSLFVHVFIVPVADWRMYGLYVYLWWHVVVVGALASINIVNQHRARLVLGWVTVCVRVNSLGI